MEKFEVNNRVINLAEELIREGYTGTVELVNSYPSGAQKIMEGSFSLRLSGFCKESLYMTVDKVDGEIGLIGRYEVKGWYGTLSVEMLAELAWHNYQSYKSSGYSRPVEWEKIWLKYGYLVERTTTVIEENQA